MTPTDPPANPDSLNRFRWYDTIGFLFGSRGSILRVIGSKRTLWIGAALVLTAAIGREYDAISFRHEPWDLLAPFGASLIISSILFMTTHCFLAGKRRQFTKHSWQDYRVFLAGYWMTAPLAWFYAYPIETFTDEVTAVRFNLTMLSVVSVWRVLLFARFVSVRYRVPFYSALTWIVFPCMVIAGIAFFQSMMSLVSIMGGLRLTQTQQILQEFSSQVFGICLWGTVPFLILAVCTSGLIKKEANLSENESDDESRRPADAASVSTPASAWSVPVIGFLAMGCLAIWYQPKRHLAARVDSLLVQGDFEQAIEVMSEKGQSAFPVAWDPPPHFPHQNSQIPKMSQLLPVLLESSPERWVSDRLLVQINAAKDVLAHRKRLLEIVTKSIEDSRKSDQNQFHFEDDASEKGESMSGPGGALRD